MDFDPFAQDQHDAIVDWLADPNGEVRRRVLGSVYRRYETMGSGPFQRSVLQRIFEEQEEAREEAAWDARQHEEYIRHMEALEATEAEDADFYGDMLDDDPEDEGHYDLSNPPSPITDRPRRGGGVYVTDLPDEAINRLSLNEQVFLQNHPNDDFHRFLAAWHPGLSEEQQAIYERQQRLLWHRVAHTEGHHFSASNGTPADSTEPTDAELAAAHNLLGFSQAAWNNTSESPTESPNLEEAMDVDNPTVESFSPPPGNLSQPPPSNIPQQQLPRRVGITQFLGHELYIELSPDYPADEPPPRFVTREGTERPVRWIVVNEPIFRHPGPISGSRGFLVHTDTNGDLTMAQDSPAATAPASTSSTIAIDTNTTDTSALSTIDALDHPILAPHEHNHVSEYTRALTTPLGAPPSRPRPAFATTAAQNHGAGDSVGSLFSRFESHPQPHPLAESEEEERVGGGDDGSDGGSSWGGTRSVAEEMSAAADTEWQEGEMEGVIVGAYSEGEGDGEHGEFVPLERRRH
ncbi:MAG: hypothetical protein LQ340_005092 [Diploschistes diacapsis]|nr:MAG: hypothetical protein LQ340_005092 [Diploschistes diacapsis]